MTLVKKLILASIEQEKVQALNTWLLPLWIVLKNLDSVVSKSAVISAAVETHQNTLLFQLYGTLWGSYLTLDNDSISYLEQHISSISYFELFSNELPWKIIDNQTPSHMVTFFYIFFGWIRPL